MKKTISYRKLLSIFLIILFISPLLIKWTHFLYVHHEHHHISFSDKSEFKEKHEKCPICAFEFVEFINNKKLQNTGNPESFSVYHSAFIQNACITKSNYSFYLRAPPVN